MRDGLWEALLQAEENFYREEGSVVCDHVSDGDGPPPLESVFSSDDVSSDDEVRSACTIGPWSKLMCI